MITRLELTNFTVFKDVEIEFSPKINVIIGENGTGKTHLLKAAYAACRGSRVYRSNPDAEDSELSASLTSRLVQLFLPLDEKLGKLHHHGATEHALIDASFELEKKLVTSFYNNSKTVAIRENIDYAAYTKEPAFIPTKEVLSFMKGFTSLYERYGLSFDETYQDICLLLDLPEIRPEKLQPKAKWAMEEIEAICGGRFVFYGGGKVTFQTENSEYSANTMAEGLRKLGILSRLLETGAIQPGISGPLFWDEPECNMNPKLMNLLVQILLEMSRNGQQVILATHEYVLLKWFDLLMDKGKADHIRFHILHRDVNSGDVCVDSVDDYYEVKPNSIADTFSDITDYEIRQSMGGLGK